MSPSTLTDSLDRKDRRDVAAAEFRAAFRRVVTTLIQQLEPDSALQAFPFLASYLEEASDAHNDAVTGQLLALQQLPGVDANALGVLLTVGLLEEDPRFGAVFAWAQPGAEGQQRPTLGLLTACWRDEDDCTGVRESLRLWKELGFIEVVNPEAPRIFWAFQVAPLLWDVLRGEEPAGVDWLTYQPAESLPELDALVLPEDIRKKATTIPRLLRHNDVRCVAVHGAQHNGRRTLLRAIAREGGYGCLEVNVPLKPGDARCATLCALAFMLDAMPVFTYELNPGEAVELPRLHHYSGPVGFALSRQGTVTGNVADAALHLHLPFPSPEARAELWSLSLRFTQNDLPRWTQRLLLTSGGIVRSAGLARAQAALDDRRDVQERDVQESLRAMQQPLESHAVRLQGSGGWEQMVAALDTIAELRTLESRCRFREELPQAVGPALGGGVNRGVRALLSGPSGTGKTLAARVLAAELQLDLYRLDLSAVVNKYIGETEKNLNHVLSRAEELNVILLLDEGDALLTNRTAVSSSNDRYANLETNFLLQRIESFEGILLITTNALQRIDTAFQRRMDVMVEFRLPEPEERWHLWRLHLPPEHSVDARWLEELALRCNLSGGQIRNAALHASLMALDALRPMTEGDVEQAVQREYRKMGAVCPLRRGGSFR